MLGHNFVCLSCTPKMDCGNVAKILNGLAQVSFLMDDEHVLSACFVQFEVTFWC